MNRTSKLLAGIVIISLLMIVVWINKYKKLVSFYTPAVETVTETNEEKNSPTIDESEPTKELTEWEKNEAMVAEDVLGAGTTLKLKYFMYLKGSATPYTCVHKMSDDRTAIITIFFKSRNYPKGMTLPTTTSLIVDEVVVGRKTISDGTMLAKNELVLRVRTPNGHQFDLLYDVGENMNPSPNSCSHTGKQQAFILLKDLEKMFTVEKFVLNNNTITTSIEDEIK